MNPEEAFELFLKSLTEPQQAVMRATLARITAPPTSAEGLEEWEVKKRKPAPADPAPSPEA